MKCANDRSESHGSGRHRLTQRSNPVDLGCVGDDAGRALVPRTSSLHSRHLGDDVGGEFVPISCDLHSIEKVLVRTCTEEAFTAEHA